MSTYEVFKRDRVYHPYETILKFFVDITMAACMGFLFSVYLLGKTTVVGHSMNPTLLNDTSVLINKVSYSLHDPERFDVIMFKPDVANVSEYYIKRIIGLPGETVQIKDNKVYINGEQLNDVIDMDIYNAGLAEMTITLGYDEYFVLGDNRNNSEDSRFPNVGNIKANSIVGKIWFASAPLSSVGFVK